MRGRRRALIWLALIAATIVLGLGSRRFAASLPTFIAAYAGDLLWATAAFFMFGLVWPRASTRLVAASALSFAVLIEVSQLCKAPWLDSIRRTTLGGLILGFDFVASDLACYAAGVGLGVLIELAVIRLQSESEG